MKTKLLIVCVLVFTSIMLSQKTFAQRDAGGTASNGGSADGGVSGIECITQPIPVSFKRNNGGLDGNGTCGQDGQIRLKFNLDPSLAPTLIGLTYEDGTPITRVYLPIEGDISELAKKRYISYCLLGSNIDPAKKIVAVFRYAGGCQPDIFLNEQ